MASRFINGARYAFSTALANAVTVTGISNANPGVALTATPPTLGAIVVMTSGWSLLTDTVQRVATVVAGTSFALEGTNTTDTTKYPAGQGGGSFRTASNFVEFSQVRDLQTSGGEQNFTQFQYLEDPNSRQRQKPTFKSAMSLTFSMDYDPALPWYDAAIAADAQQIPVVLRETLPAGDVIYYYGYLAFNKEPTKTLNENMQCTATFSLLSDSKRFAS